MPPDTGALAPLADHYRTVLQSLYAGEPQRGADGRLHPIDDTTRISVAEGMTLYSLCVAGGAASTLDVGLAYGFSAVFLLAALEENGGGAHTAIDPFQSADWHGIGAAQAGALAARAGARSPLSFTLIEDRSDRALVDLERAGQRCDLVFIDGYHRFDDALADFTLSARLCPAGGLVVFHDMWLASIRAVTSFVRHNRADFVHVPTACENLCVFRRVGEDERDWAHFVRFPLR
jgi:predicted O-methyltransferase YrrM